ncbi:hypothetical protein KJZ24_15620 [Enterococcus faecalis]|uniref:toxin glutamine deamidase domain-containing protein n=1 Tax=Enterococcus TaxID=1350 RepID=UPI000330613A|nr:toxin glutamine deamidase domain-containing protein [Enterococcus faecalis]EOJ27902.1 SPP1 gp7 family phage head morphogenesis protein [Enterococcus faecalis EnGen0300]EOK56467.1 SPP1 gp7 family phage head morphogenesis protein [Enterococcus faecalis EnGen0061]MBU5337675.1 hypothetical protein [Enterococcus faecalis]MBW7655330.1 hypothetical protein [Enterococcus faecalis]MCA6778376.1 hypothetical protein [Enterococcus faecalis]
MTKKATVSERYWEKRRELEDKARLKLEKKTLSELESVFERALVKIQRQLLAQADLHGITQSEMLEDFSKRDQEKYRKYIEKNYEKLMESDEAYKQFIDEYFPPFDYAKVNRLLQLRADIFSTLAGEAIASDVNGKFNNDLENITKRIYNSNSNALIQLLGGSAPGLTKNELENIMNYPWSGKTFSSRLWGNISTLEQRLSNSIINSLASGEGVVEALRTMKNDGVIIGMFKLEQGKFNRSIENLVRTEYSHFAVEGVRKSLKDVGVKQTQSWSAEDERVCSICGGRHGKEIKDDWHPPYHGRCRCTEIPIIPEISDDIDKLYEEMFGDLLDEFANDQFGVKLTHSNRKKFDEKSTDSMYNKDSKIKEIANLINAEIKKPMTVEEADRTNANPNYYKGKEYQVNCQRCVPTYEMRRRGIDAEALSSLDQSIWSDEYTEIIRYRRNKAIRGLRTFVDSKTKEPVSHKLVGGRTMKSNFSKLEKIVKEGERYELSVAWKRGGAHIVNMERLNGVLTIIDAQSGVIAPIDEYFAIRHAQPSSLNYLRVDNLEFRKELVKLIAKAKKGE